MPDSPYAPFGTGPLVVGQRSIQARDERRGREFPVELWHPVAANGAQPPRPLIVFAHASGLHRRSATFLCSHLASHGYVVAAMDHSEIVAADLASPGLDETAEQRQARVDAIIASRVPDVRFLLDFVLAGGGLEATVDGGQAIEVDQDKVGLAGHSFGGWTVLAVPESDTRVSSIVAMGPGGNSNPLPGILPLSLSFEWARDVPVLYLAADGDVPIPLAGVRELFGRTPGPRRMFELRRADHQHFLDDVEDQHEALRAMTLPGDAAWIPGAMRPVSELCSGAQAHDFVRGLALAHFDATLRQSQEAEQFLSSGAEAGLAARGVDAAVYLGC